MSMCSIAVVSTTLMLILQHRSLSRDLETRAEQRFDNSSATVERLIDHYLGRLQSRYESVATRPYIRAVVESGDVPTIADIASSLREKHGAPRLVFVDNEGQVIAGAGNARLDEQALAGVDSRLIVFEGKPFAVVSVGLRGGVLDIGRLVAAEPLPAAELESWTAISGAQVLFDREEGSSSGQRRKVLRDLEAWKLYVEAPRILAADQAAISSSRRNLFVAGAISLVVAFAAGLALSKGLVRPIQELGRAAERIGRGDFTVKLQSARVDEIGIVARAFELMTTNLRNVIVGVTESADHVESAAKRISTLTEGVATATIDQARETSDASATMDRICAQIEGVAQAASDSALVLGDSAHGSSTAVSGLVAISDALNKNALVLCEHTDERSSSLATSAGQIAASSKVLVENSAASSVAVEEIVRGTSEVNEYAEKSSRLSSRVVDIAEQGRENFQFTTDGMDAIQRETRNVEQSISGLGERIGEISGIVELIESIAEEAKLLALNGSIVAAQVGEEGRAFSVVAEQMNRLASRVFSETGKIVEAIRAVETETSNALSATGRSSESVSAGVELVNDASTTLNAIIEAARENNQNMDDVLAATKFQSQSSELALKRMEGTRAELEQIRVICSKQESITESVSQGSVALGEAAHEVLQATEAQASESARIVEIVETVRREVEGNSRSLLDQVAAFAEATERLERVNERAGANKESVNQVGTAVEELLGQAERLRDEIQRLRC
jgi:methyl-accepting chemotaxis protein